MKNCLIITTSKAFANFFYLLKLQFFKHSSLIFFTMPFNHDHKISKVQHRCRVLIAVLQLVWRKRQFLDRIIYSSGFCKTVLEDYSNISYQFCYQTPYYHWYPTVILCNKIIYVSSIISESGFMFIKHIWPEKLVRLGGQAQQLSPLPAILDEIRCLLSKTWKLFSWAIL